MLGLFTVLLFGCAPSPEKDLSGFAKLEESEITNAVKDIAGDLGLTGFDVKTYYHRSISANELSKKVELNRAIGVGNLPMVTGTDEAGLNQSETISKFDGYYEHRNVIVNYDATKGKGINYDYVSVLLVFDKIDVTQKRELLKALNSQIANVFRGDVVYIVSKADFRKQ